jgi:hypothetical protein
MVPLISVSRALRKQSEKKIGRQTGKIVLKLPITYFHM